MTTIENRDGFISIPKNEYQEVAGILSIFQQLPPTEKLAIQYYIKGRVDAERSSVELPALISHGKQRAAAL